MTVYAYESEDNFYPMIFENNIYTTFFCADGSSYDTLLVVSDDGKYYLDNPELIGVTSIYFYMLENTFTFPFNPDVYDYYFIGTLVGSCSDNTMSTFKPTSVPLVYYSVAEAAEKYYSVSDLNVYNIDNALTKGFGFCEKVDFESADNIGIRHFMFEFDVNGSGNKPAGLVLEVGIMAIDKTETAENTLSQILNQLEKMESSVNSSINSSVNQIKDAIENQYAVSDTEDFGVGQIADQVEEKLGVLSFGADTLNNFLGLFQASNAGSTVLTFPGFTIDVQGESYQVWNDMQFDLSFLEENFGILITAVRTVTVLCVWLAVLGYMVKAYEHLVNNKG